MAAALALLALATGLGCVVSLWPIADAWSLAAGPIIASSVTALVAVLSSRGLDRAARQPEMTTDEMVAALRSVLPRDEEPVSDVGRRRVA